MQFKAKCASHNVRCASQNALCACHNATCISKNPRCTSHNHCVYVIMQNVIVRIQDVQVSQKAQCNVRRQYFCVNTLPYILSVYWYTKYIFHVTDKYCATVQNCSLFRGKDV
jgi:hypothetical protein